MFPGCRHHKNQFADRLQTVKTMQAMRKYRLPAQVLKLLGYRPAKAEPTTGSNDDNPD